MEKFSPVRSTSPQGLSQNAGRRMRGERGEGRGPKDRRGKGHGQIDCDSQNLEQIEYLLYQSTQGIHFMFDNSEIAKILSKSSREEKFFTEANMKKVQALLSKFLECPTMQAKRLYLEKLKGQDFELLVRAYFQLVDNTILAHSNLRH